MATPNAYPDLIQTKTWFKVVTSNMITNKNWPNFLSGVKNEIKVITRTEKGERRTHTYSYNYISSAVSLDS